MKSIGAVPLIVLNGLRNPNVLADDTRMIQNTNSVFGNSLVYYEFGNEDDYNGVLITEWNYASDQSTQSKGQPIDDGKYNNASFMTTWTSNALHILAANGVFASMQYSVTITSLSLIASDNTLTAQGMAF